MCHTRYLRFWVLKTENLFGPSARSRATLTNSFGVDVARGGFLNAAQDSRVLDISCATFFAEGGATYPTTLATAERATNVGGFVPGETVSARLGCECGAYRRVRRASRSGTTRAVSLKSRTTR